MNYEKLVPLLAMAAITITIAAPAMKRIFSNIVEARRIRRHKRNLPGPLLGVVYPETKDKK